MDTIVESADAGATVLLACAVPAFAHSTLVITSYWQCQTNGSIADLREGPSVETTRRNPIRVMRRWGCGRWGGGCGYAVGSVYRSRGSVLGCPLGRLARCQIIL